MSQIDIVATTKPIVEALEALGIAYSIGGSVTSSTYGIARATMDVDMVAAIQLEHVDTLVEQLQPTYYIDANTRKTFTTNEFCGGYTAYC